MTFFSKILDYFQICLANANPYIGLQKTKFALRCFIDKHGPFHGQGSNSYVVVIKMLLGLTVRERSVLKFAKFFLGGGEAEKTLCELNKAAGRPPSLLIHLRGNPKLFRKTKKNCREIFGQETKKKEK